MNNLNIQQHAFIDCYDTAKQEKASGAVGEGKEKGGRGIMFNLVCVCGMQPNSFASLGPLDHQSKIPHHSQTLVAYIHSRH